MLDTEKNKKLTKKQQILLECLSWFINERGYSPTYQELAELLNNDIHSVFNKMLILQEKGYVTCINGKARTFQVIMEYDKCN